MLKQVSLKNFKAFEQVTIDLGLITVLIGPNGTGKSSVPQALALLRESRGKEGLKLSPVEFGEYGDVVHGRKEDEKVSFRLAVLLPRGDKVTYEATFDRNGLQRHWAEVSGESITWPSVGWERGSAAQVTQVEIDGGVCEIITTQRVGQPFTQHPTPAHIQQGQRMEALVSAIPNFLAKVYYVGPLRGFDRSFYSLTGLSDEPRNPEEVARAIAETEIRAKVSPWVERLAGARLESRVLGERSDRVRLEAWRDSLKLNILHEGFGIGQLMRPLVQLAVAPTEALIAIEEPEIHIYPKEQGQLTEIFREEVLATDKQLLLTTHSEHILLGFLTAVARERLKAEDLAVYYFERTDGSAKATRLLVHPKGTIEGGLKGFFDTAVEELQAFVQARVANKMKG